MGVVTSEAGDKVETDREIIVRWLTDREPLKGSVSFERTVQLSPYNTAKASGWIQYDIERDWENERIIAEARNAFFLLKAKIYEELGLQMETDENGILTEVVRNAFPGAEVVSEPQQAVEAGVGASPPHDPKQVPKGEAGKVQRRENAQWAVARFATHPHEFWDNRADKPTDRHPDIKHKDTGIGGWMD